jgi:glucose-1-phosphate thymidylyltransferase
MAALAVFDVRMLAGERLGRAAVPRRGGAVKERDDVTMKGLILSGGKGTRLRPLTYTRAKQLLPLANKPVLFYAIESLLEAGIREIGIIVGDTHEEIEAAVGDGGRWRERWGADVRIAFIQQEAPLGLAHAVKTARDFIGADRFVMFLGDNLIGQSLAPLVWAFNAPDCPYTSHILLTAVENPSQFGIAELEPEMAAQSAEVPAPVSVATAGATQSQHAQPAALSVSQTVGEPTLAPVRVKRLVEKPKVPPSNLALVGIYFFDATIFTAADNIAPSARGELEITDAIQWLIDHRYDVRANLLSGYWIDTGKMEDILDANRQVLLDLPCSVDPSARISANSSLSGAVTVQPGAVIENSVIRGPAIIGERTVVRNAYIGPFTSIYHDALVEGSEVEYSIVLEHSKVMGVEGRIEESLIGRYAEVHTSPLKPRGHKLMLGDHSRVGVLGSGK